ncbi:MAG: hypothetical protein RSD63_07995 [Eubacterium sp.]
MKKVSRHIYKWDIEELNVSLAHLKQEKENLEENRTFVNNIAIEIQKNWQSVAGTSYQQSLDVDYQTYMTILKELEKAIVELDRYANQVYQNCETQIKGRIRQLIQRIG